MQVLLALPIEATLLLAAAPPEGQESSDARVAHWREDLAVLLKELPARHKNLFFRSTQEEFEAAVTDLDESIPKLSDDEVQVELMRLVASVGDRQTTVQQGEAAPKGRLPLRLRKFSDGLRVVAIGRDRAAALGGRVVTVGGIAIDEAWRRVAEIVSHDNDAALDAFVPEKLET